MQRTLRMLKLFIPLLLIYFVLIHVLALSIIYADYLPSRDNNDSLDTGEVKVGFGDKVTVRVDRDRWYGTIQEEIDGEDKVSYVRLLYFIKIPLEIKGLNFYWIHFFFIFLIGIVFLVSIGRDIIGAFKGEEYYE